MFKVTYKNSIDGNRYTLIDNLSKEDAEGVKQRFGDKNDPFYYLDGLKVEEDI